MQLCLGRVVQTTANKREYWEEHLTKYDLDEELILAAELPEYFDAFRGSYRHGGAAVGDADCN